MRKILLICVATLATLALYANNIKIANVTLTGTNTGSQYAMIQFDLSWDNSWRVSTGPSNWDAAWVFIKYRVKNDTTWHHATLHYADGTGTGDGHIPASGATIASNNDNGAGGSYGVFIYHNAPIGQGSVSYAATQLRWDYGVNGVPTPDSVTDLQAFAIEMVYVPQGSFKAGSGGGPEEGAFYTYPDTTQPYTVSSEAAITIGPVPGQLYYNPTPNNTDYSGDRTGTVVDSFPKGYNAFYVMKYEVTQDQYTAFLNTLTSVQAYTRAYGFQRAGLRTGPNSGSRMGITLTGSGGYSTTNPYVACNFIAYPDLAAYLDWAGLRLMTELEYEKACRGPLPPVPGEFAWGTAQINNQQYTISDISTAYEAVDSNYSNLGNANVFSTHPLIANNEYSPLRVGIFAANPGNTGRVTAGATYYGIMEMTGNVFEDIITVGDPISRSFDGLPGDGQLDDNGFANQPTWPPYNLFTPAGNLIGGSRGGSIVDNNLHYCTVSDRSRISAFDAQVGLGNIDSGGRGARTAP
jgi:formylglycine-generating enzyme required for sulfatase activity